MSTPKHSKGEARPQYAPLPLPALQDERVSRRHLRALAVIAYHDRFGANGSGCYLSQPVLAEKAGIHANNVSRIIHDLEAWGHIEVERRSRTLRRAQLHVRYTTNASDDPWTPPETTRDGEVSGAGKTTRGDEVSSEQTERGHEVSPLKTSSDDEQNISPEGEIRNPARATPLAQRAPVDNPLQFLTILDRRLESRPPTTDELQTLCDLAFDHDEAAVRGMAERITVDAERDWPEATIAPDNHGVTKQQPQRSAAERSEGVGDLYRKDYTAGTTNINCAVPDFLRDFPHEGGQS